MDEIEKNLTKEITNLAHQMDLNFEETLSLLYSNDFKVIIKIYADESAICEIGSEVFNQRIKLCRAEQKTQIFKLSKIQKRQK